jgi:hypothetical protein
MTSRDIKALVADMDRSLRSDDPRLHRSSVLIVHEDGSSMFFRFAFMVRHGNWLLVFTEHQGSHSFAINDLESYFTLETNNDPMQVVDEFGVPVVKLCCSFCKNEITVKDICSVYDESGNRIDADVCEGCEELHIRQQFEPPATEPLISALFD